MKLSICVIEGGRFITAFPAGSGRLRERSSQKIHIKTKNVYLQAVTFH